MSNTYEKSREFKLEDALVKAYELVYEYWAGPAGADPGGDEAKELRRAIWYQCLKPHGIPHPKGMDNG